MTWPEGVMSIHIGPKLLTAVKWDFFSGYLFVSIFCSHCYSVARLTREIIFGLKRHFCAIVVDSIILVKLFTKLSLLLGLTVTIL